MNCAAVVHYITDWLSGRADESRLKGFVVGVSGGIDSALTSTLCAKSGKPTLCLSLPIHQPPDHLTRAAKHIAWLLESYSNVEAFTVDLTSAFDVLTDALPHAARSSLALANSRSRLRMLTLYAFANSYGYLVAGTGNKVEDFGVGFFTKYGDGGVDISPIGDLLKSQVRELAGFLGVTEEIVKAVPTDGLWTDDRSDETQIGASYDELESAMRCHALGHYSLTQMTDREKDVYRIFSERHKGSRHKLELPPVCLIPDHLKM